MLGVAVTVGFAFQAKIVILVDVSVLRNYSKRVVWCNFAEDMKMSCRHSPWQAQYFVRVGGVEVEF